MIRVVVTDDSAFMRRLLSDIINSDPELEVIATARDGQDLLGKLDEFKPDVMTLDISMPVMDGMTALQKIMATKPTPTIMISALSDEKNTFKCLELGAVDFIPKTSGIISIDMTKKRDVIISKIKAAAKAKLDSNLTEQNIETFEPTSLRADGVIVMGASTGGPRAIESILSAFTSDFPVPILIVQHMPHEFARAFAERLNKNCAISVKEARSGETIQKGKAYISPGDVAMSLEMKGAAVSISIDNKVESQTVVRSIDALMRSVSGIYKDMVIGVLLSGIGSDGTEGLKAIKMAHGKTIVQDEGSCVVPSMPRNAINAGVVDKVVPLSAIAKEIVMLLR
jgi:two-component system chemotaxis response regulator CheB